ncbi:membrane dipeptidase-domain-containing protein [Gautieria morchelliformis]|nr:membrane dipeptidase-domain-containing protein [Gautieria morchelliformis]
MMSEVTSDRTPLLQDEAQEPVVAGTNVGAAALSESQQREARKRSIVSVLLTFLFIAAVVVSFTVWNESLSRDPHKAALSILEKAPVIDGHIDLPWLVRAFYRNNVTAVDLRNEMPGHVDIPRLRKGRVGGFFWSVYTSCQPDGPDFMTPMSSARDTLEQIDVARLMIDKYNDVFQLATDVTGLQKAIANGKIASMLGVEGGHQLENSIGALRAYHALGVRYLTLTHSCHNAFADSAGILVSPKPKHGGLSLLGRSLVRELNRLGILVDLSHTADSTALQALALSEAPVIWSHSSARAVWDVPRNLPDYILRQIGLEKGQKDAVVMVNFAPQFVAADGNATLQAVADHVEHIGAVSGRKHVGLGSDFDGIGSVPRGLEDVSKYPDLFAELRSRGWSKADLVGLAGGNLIRVWKGVEAVALRMQSEGVQPAYDIYDKREDM